MPGVVIRTRLLAVDLAGKRSAAVDRTVSQAIATSVPWIKQLHEFVDKCCSGRFLSSLLFLSKPGTLTRSCQKFLIALGTTCESHIILLYHVYVRMYTLYNFSCICAFHTFSWALERYLQQVRTSPLIYKHPSLETPCSQVALRRKSTGIAMSTWSLEWISRAEDEKQRDRELPTILILQWCNISQHVVNKISEVADSILAAASAYAICAIVIHWS